jgi:hypothetical protein
MAHQKPNEIPDGGICQAKENAWLAAINPDLLNRAGVILQGPYVWLT